MIDLAYVLDWLHLLARWLHVAAAMAWIGTSFYFIALDHSLRPPADERAAREGIGGEAWEIHGGGFYRVEKFRVAPARLPDSLQWFKWEAYLTWLSGFSLVVLLYYLDPRLLLVDPAVAELQPWQAVGASLGLIAASWLAYDALSRALQGRPLALSIGIAALVVASALAAQQLFSARGAAIQVGAMAGTWMAANVLFVIIPGQRELVAAKRAGREPDPVQGVRGKQRSIHNNYLTLPVLFTMLSPHVPFTYGQQPPALGLLGLMAAGVAVQHFLNLRRRGRTVWALPALALAGVAGIAVWVAPAAPTGAAVTAADFPAVRAVFQERCSACHSASPTYPGLAAPPKDVTFESPEAISRHARRVYQQVVVARVMPLGNATGMTVAERDLIGRWYRSGAPVP